MYTINQRTTHARNKQLALRIHRSSTAENCCCYHEYKWTNISCCQGVFVHSSLFFSSASSLQRMWQFADFLWSLFVVLWTFSSFCHFHKSFLLTTVCLEAPPACCVSLCWNELFFLFKLTLDCEPLLAPACFPYLALFLLQPLFHSSSI